MYTSCVRNHASLLRSKQNSRVFRPIAYNTLKWLSSNKMYNRLSCQMMQDNILTCRQTNKSAKIIKFFNQTFIDRSLSFFVCMWSSCLGAASASKGSQAAAAGSVARRQSCTVLILPACPQAPKRVCFSLALGECHRWKHYPPVNVTVTRYGKCVIRLYG
jgi:hypothetical protein